MSLDQESGNRDTPAGRLADLAHHRLGAMSDVQQARGMAGVLAAFKESGPRRRAWHVRPLFLVGAAISILVVAGVIVGAKSFHQEPLTYVMSGGEIQAGGYFRVGDHAQPIIRFSDGTKLTLKAGARGRVASVDALGARVMLDDGEAQVSVVPRVGARWLFDAGPFLVRVRGTEFDLAWNADEGKLDVRLRTGALSVDGPLSNQAVSLRGGQWLTVRLATQEVFVRNLDDNPPAPSVAPAPAAAIAPEPAPALQPSPVASSHPAPSHPSHAPDLDWSKARAEGSWDRILDAATKRGIDRSLGERGSEDLALLADAAHYLHRDDIAERTLLAIRKRFGGTTRAKDAAFLLGRIIEARPGGAKAALEWYDRHLEEAPSGVYASEALGRKMTVLGRLGDEGARPVAKEYLRRYPAGSYARAARAYAERP
jgi:TolA-binding protein